MSSPKTSSSPSVTVTLGELAAAIDNMGLSRTISAASLYNVLRGPSDYTPPPELTPSQSKSNRSSLKDQGLIRCFSRPASGGALAGHEKHRKLMEMTKASFPNGVRDKYYGWPDCQASSSQGFAKDVAEDEVKRISDLETPKS